MFEPRQTQQVPIQGPAGPKGDQGPAGPQGPYGPQGPAGGQGPKGDRGPQGPSGRDAALQGPVGPTGPKGPKGERGPIGPKGEDAKMRGPQGNPGPEGLMGPQGLPGESGAEGKTGPVGPQGLTGPIGPVGLEGPRGPKGEKGDKGEKGERGKTGMSGGPGTRGPAGAGASLAVQDEGVSITSGATTFNFVGAGIAATAGGSTVTVTVGGAGTPGGSNTQVQYNNAGVFGGISGATTDGTTLTLVTPVLGAATGTSLALSGATIGSNALAVTGTSQFSSSLKFGTTSSAAMIKPNGAAINFRLADDSADAAITAASLAIPATGTVDLSGGAGAVNIQASGTTTIDFRIGSGRVASIQQGQLAFMLGKNYRIGWPNNTDPDAEGPDLVIARLNTANLRQGNAPSATPVAQIFTLGEASRGGTDTNIAGANGTIESGPGTGSGTGSAFIVRTPTTGSTGTTAQAQAQRLKLTDIGVFLTTAALPTSDPGVAGQLYRTAGAVMISL